MSHHSCSKAQLISLVHWVGNKAHVSAAVLGQASVVFSAFASVSKGLIVASFHQPFHFPGCFIVTDGQLLILAIRDNRVRTVPSIVQYSFSLPLYALNPPLIIIYLLLVKDKVDKKKEMIFYPGKQFSQASSPSVFGFGWGRWQYAGDSYQCHCPAWWSQLLQGPQTA